MPFSTTVRSGAAGLEWCDAALLAISLTVIPCILVPRQKSSVTCRGAALFRRRPSYCPNRKAWPPEGQHCLASAISKMGWHEVTELF
jgi:hypothetical protein